MHDLLPMMRHGAHHLALLGGVVFVACNGTPATDTVRQTPDASVDPLELGGDDPDSGRFWCGDKECEPDEWCRRELPNPSDPSAVDGDNTSCLRAPETCADEPSCACLHEAELCLDPTSDPEGFLDVLAGDASTTPWGLCDTDSGGVTCTLVHY